MASVSGTALRLANLSKAFGQTEVLKNFSLDVRRGEFLTLLGPSGCGKTTLLNLVAGFFPPDRGSIEIEGTDVTAIPAYCRNTAMVFQSYALFPHLTVADNVAFGLRMRTQLGRGAIAKRVAEALDLVKLTGLHGRYPQQLSGGQQQRVALARALILKPALLLLDEPLSNLDAGLREAMQVELRSLQRDVGVTTVLVTHDQVEAFVVSDRIAVIQDGALEQLGTPSDVYRGPTSRNVANFVGRMNWIPGHMLEDQVFAADLGGGVHFRIRLRTTAPAGTAGDLMIRPEQVRLHSERPASPNPALAGIVREQIYVGSTTFCHVEVGGTTLIAHRLGSPITDPGPVFVSLEDSELAFMRSQPLASSDRHG
jgi:putative spermidine/putrescine transport system ATP-binding protein